MTAQTKPILKTYFETNDIPTQGQYADFIDSYPNVVDENQAVGIDSAVVPVYPPTQGTAYGISARYNFISSVGTNTAAIILPPATVGKMITVGSAVSNSVTVYPASGEKFDVIATNTGYLMYQRESITFMCLIAGEWTWISNAPENGHYFVYEALVSQSSTNAPTATVVRSNYPGTMTYGYSVTGQYTLTNTGNFPLATTLISPDSLMVSFGRVAVFSAADGNVINIRTANSADTSSNSILSNTTIKLKTRRY